MYDDLDPAGGLLARERPEHDAGAIRFQRVRDLGGVINVTFQFLRENLREYGRVLLVLLGPVVLVAALASYVAQVNMAEALVVMPGENGAPADPFVPLAGLFTPAYGLTILLALLAQILLATLTYGYIDLYRRGEAGAITPGRVWEEARHLMAPFLGYGFLFGTLIALSVLIWIVPCLGTLAWLAGFIYFWPILVLVFVARATDREDLRGSWERARSLIKGRWWPTFGVLFVAGVILVIVNLVLSLPGAIAGFGIGLNSLSPAPSSSVDRGLFAIGALLSTLMYAAYPIYLVAAAFQYGSLVEQEEGTALSAGLDALAGRAEAAPAAPARRFRPEADEGFGTWRTEPPVSERPPSEPSASGHPSGFRGGGFDDDAEAGAA